MAMASFRRCCAEVREPSELWFGLVRGVGQGVAVLDGIPRRARGKGDCGRGFRHFYADFAATCRSIFIIRLRCASASAGLARTRNS